MIGQWTTERAPSPDAGPLVWIRADDLYPTLHRVVGGGRAAVRAPVPRRRRALARRGRGPGGQPDRRGRARAAAAAQTLIAVRDVEASSRWYQRLLGLRSDHGGPHYERLLAGGELVLQLHHADVEHHHGRIGDPRPRSATGCCCGSATSSDFDDVVARAAELGAPVVRAPHRNPPEGEGFGPGHREIWVSDPDGYTVVVASPDGEAIEPNPGGARRS